MAGIEKVKFPPFMKNDPERWFDMVELAFEMNGVRGDLAKFYAVSNALDPVTVKQFEDVFYYHIPDANKYEYIKRTIINRLTIDRIRPQNQFGMNPTLFGIQNQFGMNPTLFGTQNPFEMNPILLAIQKKFGM